MALEDLPNGFVAPTRVQIRDRYQKDVQFRTPGAQTGKGSQAFVDGSTLADAMSPLYADAVSMARGANREDMTRNQLKAECRARGIPEELPASGAGGYVKIDASVGGVYIPDDKQLRYEAGNILFRCLVSDTYYAGKPVPIIAVDGGPSSNLPAGSILKWAIPTPGLSNQATVIADANGDGLIGGRNAESDDDIRRRLSDYDANPPAAGNVGQVRELVIQAGRALGVPIQQVFVYPAVVGSGHYAYVFTLRPGVPGSTRCPNAVQIAQVRAFVLGALPADDGALSAAVEEDLVLIKVGVKWATKAVGWADAAPWPILADEFTVTVATSATAFRVASVTPTPTAPQAGQTIAFYKKSTAAFARKRILSVSAVNATTYDIVVDDSNAASDVNYTPTVAEPFCPYAPSLDLVPKPLFEAVGLLGVGEQVEEPFDEGLRQWRDPRDPAEWPSMLRHKDLDGVESLPQVLDASWLAPTIPHLPPVGTPGAVSKLVAIDRILAFPI